MRVVIRINIRDKLVEHQVTTAIYEKIKATDRLPSPTGVALELLRLADAEDTTAATITPVVESDPAIASRLIGMANSSVSGQSRKFVSVQQAVKYLGLLRPSDPIRRRPNEGPSLSCARHGLGPCGRRPIRFL